MGKHTGQPRSSGRGRVRTSNAAKSFVGTPDMMARHVVQWYRDCGASRKLTLERTGLDQDFIRTWYTRDSVVTQPGRGPKQLINHSQALDLKKAVVKVRFMSATKVGRDIMNPFTGRAVSKMTKIRALHRVGTSSKKVKKKQLLTAKNIAIRKAWCEKHLEEKTNFELWDFSDEKWWVVGGVQGNERMWVDDDEPDPDELYVPTAAHPVKVHIWAAISWSGRSSLHIHDGKVDSKVYQMCLDDAYLPCVYEKDYLGHKRRQKVVFQQDGASCHMSKGTRDWLENKMPKSFSATYETGISGWPASSPDLNIIETLWAILQDRVIEQKAYSYDKLVECVTQEWWNISQTVIQNLYNSIPTRLQKCINADGKRFRI
jgi:hypothetical protein